MLSIILVLIIIFIAAGIIGIVVKGLLWLFIIAVILFIITILSSFLKVGKHRGQRHAEETAAKDKDDKK